MPTLKSGKNVALYNEMKDAVAAALKPFGDKLSGQEILAVLSQIVGMTIAMQDSRVITPAMAMELVAKNIESGNAQALKDLDKENGSKH